MSASSNAEPSTPNDHRMAEVDSWTKETSATIMAVCDRAAGGGLMAIALVSAVLCYFDQVSWFTVVVLFIMPLLNVGLSQLKLDNPIRHDVMRMVVNIPLLLIMYAVMDGVLERYWFAHLALIAATSLSITLQSRKKPYGYAITAFYVASLAIANVAHDDARWTRVLVQIIGLSFIGIILSETGAHLGKAIVEARFRRMAAEIGQRELDRRNGEMRLVLDNVRQGLVTIDLDGCMARERSSIVEHWLGPIPPTELFSDYLVRIDEDMAAVFALNLEQIKEDVFPIEVTLAQMPRRMRVGEWTLELSYQSIFMENILKGILVVITDISAQEAQERLELEQRELLHVLAYLARDRSGLIEFMADANKIVQSLVSRPRASTPVEKRLLHTLKGNAGMVGLVEIPRFCHEIESKLKIERRGLLESEREELGRIWSELLVRLDVLVGDREGSDLRISVDDYRKAYDLIQAGACAEQVLTELRGWLLEPVDIRFERFTKQAQQLARRLGKGTVKVQLHTNGIRLDPKIWSSFWSAFVHAVRNAVDHGIEAPEVRLISNKPETGTLHLQVFEQSQALVISIGDDGGGVDWDRLAGKAAERGFTWDDEVDLLFFDGLSSKEDANELSGRGVGMAALKDATRALGGYIEVDSQRMKGTVIRFVFPKDRIPMPIPTLQSSPEPALHSP